MIYLDNNATTPVHPEVLAAMLPYYKEEFGNASTIYQVGQRARKAVENAREKLAVLIGAESADEIIFTAGATESNNMAIKGVLEAHPNKGRRMVSTAIEHSSVRNVLQYLSDKGKIENVVVPVSANGITDLTQFKEALTDDTLLATAIAVNNEIGTLQPLREISKECRKHEIIFLTDAVQAAGKIPIDVKRWGVDLLSLSAHKFSGPKGVGILYIRKGTRLEALLQGGSHEKNRRAGTENVAVIVGMGKAAEWALKEMNRKNKTIQAFRDRLEKKILEGIPLTSVNGDPNKRVANTTNICFEYAASSELLMALDLKGIACSSGSACATGSPEASHVLLAMGIPQDKAHSSLRFSLGPQNTEEEVDLTVATLKGTVERLRKNHPLWKETASR